MRKKRINNVRVSETGTEVHGKKTEGQTEGHCLTGRTGMWKVNYIFPTDIFFFFARFVLFLASFETIEF